MLRVAVPLSRRLKARLVLVHVAQTPVVPGPSAVPGAYEELCEAALVGGYTLLDRVADVYGAPSDAELAVELGDPADRLAAIANERRAKLIVVAARRRRRVTSALLGSVSASLAARASTPVIVVPPDARNGRDPADPSMFEPSAKSTATGGEAR